MLDHQEVRIWADHHAAFSRWVANAAHRTADVFAVLTEQQYDAPWRRRAKRGRVA